MNCQEQYGKCPCIFLYIFLGEVDLMGLYFNPCIITAGVPELPDPDCKRTFVWTMDGIKSLSETRRCVQPDSLGHRQHYLMPFARTGDSGGFARAGWGISPDLIRVPLAAKVAEDFSRAVGTVWRNASGVAYNWSDTHHCMHSIPCFGFLNAGEEKTIEGRIYFVEGGIEALTKRVKRSFPSLFYQDPVPLDPSWVIDD